MVNAFFFHFSSIAAGMVAVLGGGIASVGYLRTGARVGTRGRRAALYSWPRRERNLREQIELRKEIEVEKK